MMARIRGRSSTTWATAREPQPCGTRSWPQTGSRGSGRTDTAEQAPSDQGVHRGRAAMSQHRLFYFMELKEPKAACGLFPSLSWCCCRVEWRPGQKFHDAYRDVGDGVIEVWQDRFVFAADPGGIEYDAGQT